MEYQSLKEIDVDELLKIAESGSEKIRRSNKKVEQYIKHFSITEGDTFVPCSIIYHHYRQFKKQNYLSKIMFFRQFKKIFESAKVNNEVGYYLDDTPFNNTQEGYFKAKAFLRKERDAKKKKKRKQKSKDVTKKVN